MKFVFFIWGCLFLFSCQEECPHFSLRQVIENDTEYKALHGGFSKTWVLHQYYSGGFLVDYSSRDEKQYLILNNKGHYEASELKNLGKKGMIQGKYHCKANKNELFLWEYRTDKPKKFQIFEINDSTLCFGEKRNYEMAVFRPLNIKLNKN